MDKLSFLLICTLIGSVHLQSNTQSNKVSYQNPCGSKITCHECIQTQKCAWCMQPDFGERPRCFDPAIKSTNNVCDEEFIWYPDNEQIMFMNEELTKKRQKGSGGMMIAGGSSSGSASGSSSASGGSSASGSGSASASGSIHQISPQRVGLRLRASESTQEISQCHSLFKINYHFLIF